MIDSRCPEGQRASPALKALCITADADRPTKALFDGLRDAGLDLTVACLTEVAHGRMAGAGHRMLELPITRGLGLRAARVLRSDIRAARYDVLHTLSGRALQIGLLATRGIPIRIVAYRGTIGNVSFLDPSSWLRFLNPRVDRIVCVSEAVRRFFLGMRPRFLAVAPERLVTIHKGHDLAWYTAPPADLSELGIPSGAFVATCVANYRPHKGLEWLVRSMRHVPADVHLLLVGNVGARLLDEAILASPAAERIHRPGYRDDAAALAAASDVFVMPSTGREGFPRALVEAMAYAVAPVVSDCGGNVELVADGESGIVVPVNDEEALGAAVERLYRDPDERRCMGEAARRRIGKRFRIEGTIAATLALYRELTAESGV